MKDKLDRCTRDWLDEQLLREHEERIRRTMEKLLRPRKERPMAQLELFERERPQT